jgi:ribosomal protein S25
MPAPNPIAFISHATEDKMDFVIPFATELRKNGIEAWVDQWEIRAGDSLIQRIFEEGIRNAAVVIVVLSKISTNKKWVREELDAALIRRISDKTRLIPVVIDDCEVPVALRATKWVRYEQNNIKTVVDEIVRAIFGASEKPPLGPPPTFTKSNIPPIPGLDKIDTTVLHAIGEIFVEQGTKYIDRKKLDEKIVAANLSAPQLDESLEMLEDNFFIAGSHAIGKKFIMIELKSSGARIVLQQQFPDLDEKFKQILEAIVNDNIATNEGIAGRHSIPIAVVDYVLEELEGQGLLKRSQSISGPDHIFETSVRLKRMLR